MRFFDKLLIKDVPWSWVGKCQLSFVRKHSHQLKFLLTIYLLELAFDTSFVRVGAVLYHTNPDGSEQPTAYASDFYKFAIMVYHSKGSHNLKISVMEEILVIALTFLLEV